MGNDSCQRARQTCVATVTPLRSALLSRAAREEAGEEVNRRYETSADRRVFLKQPCLPAQEVVTSLGSSGYSFIQQILLVNMLN